MPQVYRITNHEKNQVTYVGKKPEVRKYLLENKDTGIDNITVETIEWNYKTQLVDLLNQAVSAGHLTGMIDSKHTIV